MAKQQKIKVIRYVHVGDKLVNRDDLSPEQQKQLATWIKCTYLNNLFLGKARFYPADEADKEKYLSDQKRVEQWAKTRKSSDLQQRKELLEKSCKEKYLSDDLNTEKHLNAQSSLSKSEALGEEVST